MSKKEAFLNLARVLLVCGVTLWPLQKASAAFIETVKYFNNDNLVAIRISDLEIESRRYEVTFAFDTFANLSANSFPFFGDMNKTEAARDAIALALNNFDGPLAFIGTSSFEASPTFWLPYEEFTSDVGQSRVRGLVSTYGITDAFLPGAGHASISEIVEFAILRPAAIPAPSTIALSVLGLFFIMLEQYRRGRSRK